MKLTPVLSFEFTFAPLSMCCFTAEIFPLSTAPNTSRSAREGPHINKNAVAIAVVRKFFIVGRLSSHRVSLSSRFKFISSDTELHRDFPQTPTGLDALLYGSGAMPKHSRSHTKVFWINGRASTLASEKKTGLENPNRRCHCVHPSGMRG